MYSKLSGLPRCPGGTYCDAFVSRPDNVPDQDYPAIGYFTPRWQRVFRGRRVLLVRGGVGDNLPSTADKTVFDRHLAWASSVEHLMSFMSARGVVVTLSNSSRNIFQEYAGLRDSILSRLSKGSFDVIVLSLGPTATVLAAELSCRGYQAIDVGQFGGNFTKRN